MCSCVNVFTHYFWNTKLLLVCFMCYTFICRASRANIFSRCRTATAKTTVVPHNKPKLSCHLSFSVESAPSCEPSGASSLCSASAFESPANSSGRCADRLIAVATKNCRSQEIKLIVWGEVHCGNKTLNHQTFERVRRGEEDSSFCCCCMLTQ